MPGMQVAVWCTRQAGTRRKSMRSESRYRPTISQSPCPTVLSSIKVRLRPDSTVVRVVYFAYDRKVWLLGMGSSPSAPWCLSPLLRASVRPLLALWQEGKFDGKFTEF